ncbi:hypothetical protein BKA82DRAFT_25737 [Pisolithus tinctorius]|nr:hypothetical protein BKA82DRAFT_25737 [Pisolithus tinctorius]
METGIPLVTFPDQVVDKLETATLAELDASLRKLISSAQLVLVMIFTEVVKLRGDAGLRAISQVCQQWQKVALQAPMLWERVLVFSGKPRWTSEMLRRTLNTPLDISINPVDLPADSRALVISNVMTAADHFWRFRAFNLAAPYPYICKFFDLVSFDRNEAPHLRVLSLSSQNWGNLPECNKALPVKLLTLATPCLEYLVLQGCHFHWDAMSSGLARSYGLSTLHIDYPEKSDPASKPSTFALLTALVPLTSLKELKLRNATKPDPTSQWDHSTVILPQLQTLHLRSSMQLCADFLGRIEAPTIVRLDIDCNTTTSDNLLIVLKGTANGDFCRININGVLRRVNYLSLPQIFVSLANMPSVWAVEELMIAFSTDIHTMVAVGTWPYLLERLRKVTSRINLYHLYFDARDALEAQTLGWEVGIQLPLLEVIVVPPSSELRKLVATITDLRGQLAL